jgi:hypothetical protein
MRLGIIGLPQSGKSTVFEALTLTRREPAGRVEPKIGTVRVSDPRVEQLSAMFRPEKTTLAQVEYLLPGLNGRSANRKAEEEGVWNGVRTCDALVHVVRNFSFSGFAPASPAADFARLDHEMIFADLMTLTKRLDRLRVDKDRGKKYDPAEVVLLEECIRRLESDQPLRHSPELTCSAALKGFALVSAKPALVLFNNDDWHEAPPDVNGMLKRETCMVVRGRLEAELAMMSHKEAREFHAEFGISGSALDRIVRASHGLLGLISFFTVGEDEVRAWTVRRGTPALDAADVIHSDIRKGFIRAEVLAYDDLAEAGSYAEARRRGTVRLEGKTYSVNDGDIIEFRFSV